MFCLGNSHNTAARHPDFTHDGWDFQLDAIAACCSPWREAEGCHRLLQEKNGASKELSETLPTDDSLDAMGQQSISQARSAVPFTSCEMTLRLTYMKKKSHVADTDPQQSLIISMRELYFQSRENQEQTLGTPRERQRLASWVASRSRALLGDWTFCASASLPFAQRSPDDRAFKSTFSS